MSSGPVRRRETFSRDDRLRKRREFEECYASGVRVSGRHLQLFFLPVGPVPPGESRASDGTPDPAKILEAAAPRPRLGISVPRRIGGAVVRNRVRRRLREIFRRNREVFGGRAGNVVVNARPSAGGASFSELAEEYRTLLTRSFERTPDGRRSAPTKRRR